MSEAYGSDINNPRQIKFRARHVRTGKVFSAEQLGSDELTINPDGRGFVNVNGTSTKLSEYYPHLRPEQFTGRLDRDGREIYEHDQVQLGTTDNGNVFVVLWGREHAAWQLHKEGMFVPLATDSQNMRVVPSS